MSAPDRALSQPGYTGPSYLDQMVDLISSCASKDVVLDRTHYGELIWPNIFNRKPLLNDDDYQVLREVEETVDVTRILMHDPNVEAHWQRCVDNNEPLTRIQFLQARMLYERMANKYKFEKKTLKDYVEIKDHSSRAAQSLEPVEVSSSNVSRTTGPSGAGIKTPEQLKLEKANAINTVLSKRIIKSKGAMFDELETDIRGFLRERLGKIFGEQKQSDLTKDEVQIIKLLCKTFKDKEKTR